MMPPQVRPTENASSSLTPYRCSTAARSDRTASASSYTAPSTQPPETEPTAVPSGPTSIAAPGWRGADFQVPITVPRPTVSPERHQDSRSVSTSRMRDHLREGVQGIEGVAGQQVVEVRQRRGHAGGDGGEAVLAPVRVDPPHGVGEPGQPGHLLAQQGGVAALPPVRRDDDDRPPGRPALPPEVQEGPQRLAEPGAAAPVRDGRPGRGQRLVRVAEAQLPGDPGQAGAGGEDLRAAGGDPDGGVG